jgi:two-component system sensor histidine kinase TctE
MGSPASPERAAPALRELSPLSPDLPEADPDVSRDARYANPFAPPDELEPDGEPAPRSLFGEILDWMLAPLLLCGR